MKERDIQAKIRKDLKQLGYLTLKLEPRDVVGLPDLMVLGNSGNPITAFIEVKTDTGKLSPKQEATIYTLLKRGYVVHVAYGVDGWNEIKNQSFPSIR